MDIESAAKSLLERWDFVGQDLPADMAAARLAGAFVALSVMAEHPSADPADALALAKLIDARLEMLRDAHLPKCVLSSRDSPPVTQLTLNGHLTVSRRRDWHASLPCFPPGATNARRAVLT